MASNESTPESVLNAPKQTFAKMHEAMGPSRRERRLMKIAEVLNTPYENQQKRQARADRIQRILKRKGRR